MELKVVFFVVFAFFVGLALNFYKDQAAYLPAEKFDYTSADSTFKYYAEKNISADSAWKIVEKRVDSEPELLDFRARELSSGVDLHGNLHPKIDLNSAPIDLLCTLPGIGLKTAEKIIDYRIRNGAFKSIDDLMNVKGIGKVKFGKLKEYIFIE